MTKVWLVFSGVDNGSREDCSVFYETPKAFHDEAQAKEHEKNEDKRLSALVEDPDEGGGDPWTFCYSVEVH